MSTKQWNFSCQRRRAGREICGVRRRTGSETKLRVYCCEKQDGTGGGAGDQITWAGSRLGAARDRTGCRRGTRLGPRQDAGGGRGRDWDKMPAGKSPGRQRTRSGQGPDGMPAGGEAWAGTRCRRGPRLSRQGANQLKRKRSIISSSNSGFSKSFSLVMIKLLCSKNSASW